MKAVRKISFSSIVLAGAVAFAPMAFAAGPKPAAADAEFRTMDTNKDGKVSAAEHAAASKKMFETMDANGVGKVTAAVAEQKFVGEQALIAVEDRLAT